MLDNKTILITGGTGSFGKQFVKTVLTKFKPKRLIIFSRDELKQFEMREQFSEQTYPCLRYFIGDIRDRSRLTRAFNGVDFVIHAAALKQVSTCEYNPIEAVKTNVMGAANVIDAAIDCKVRHVIALSTDKAVSPINLYGATKLCSDKLFVSANNYSGADGPKFSVVRYGNVVGSRGSVIPVFMKARQHTHLDITDQRMTRFWITVGQSVNFVLQSLLIARGGEIYIPKLPSMKIVDLANAIAPHCKFNVIGARPGEKLHEMMISEEDARYTLDIGDYYLILPFSKSHEIEMLTTSGVGVRCPEGFCYSSHHNDHWLTRNDLAQMVSDINIPLS
ncbi:MAG: UDP-N-acetylglucosamine 4,6-dehydratase (inverting) [Gammaproteobacteria bacterium]|nr:UDP-N-acetylglucosamine 4,6-dehydratase (inverting) [Gammaproteobacteria bacterium]